MDFICASAQLLAKRRGHLPSIGTNSKLSVILVEGIWSWPRCVDQAALNSLPVIESSVSPRDTDQICSPYFEISRACWNSDILSLMSSAIAAFKQGTVFSLNATPREKYGAIDCSCWVNINLLRGWQQEVIAASRSWKRNKFNPVTGKLIFNFVHLYRIWREILQLRAGLSY